MNKKNKLSLLSLSVVAVAVVLMLTNENSTEDEITRSTPIKNVTQPTTITPAVAATSNHQPLSVTALSSLAISNDEHDNEDSEPTESLPMNPIDRIKAIQNKTALHEAILEDHDRFTRYPEHNARFETPETDPTVVRYELDERTTENKEDHTALTIWSDEKYYLHNDTVTVFASLRDANGRVIPTQFAGQLIYDEQVSLQHLTFTDSNLDGIHEVSFPLSEDKGQNFEAGVYKVLVVNNTNPVADAVTFTLSEPELALSGKFRDRVENGSLLVEAQVQVESKNRFYFQASLYSENGTPIGSAQHTVELPAGKHWIPLGFDGLMIQDAGEEGPYTLKNISLAKVALPIQRAPLQSPDYLTQDYSLDQFRNTRFIASN